MFNAQIKRDIEYLERKFKEEREERWVLETKVARLMDFLGVYEEQQPNIILKRKEKTNG